MKDSLARLDVNVKPQKVCCSVFQWTTSFLPLMSLPCYMRSNISNSFKLLPPECVFLVRNSILAFTTCQENVLLTITINGNCRRHSYSIDSFIAHIIQ